MLSMSSGWVQSLVEELRSHKPQSVAIITVFIVIITVFIVIVIMMIIIVGRSSQGCSKSEL